VQLAFQPSGGRYGLVTHLQDSFVAVLDRESYQAVKRIEVGQPQANASFTPDGATAFVTVTGRDEVAVIDMQELAVAARIKTGGQPMGLVLLDPAVGARRTGTPAGQRPARERVLCESGSNYLLSPYDGGCYARHCDYKGAPDMEQRSARRQDRELRYFKSGAVRGQQSVGHAGMSDRWVE